MTFSEWVSKCLDERGWRQARLAKEAGLVEALITQGINDNEWSLRSVILVSNVFGKKMESRGEVEAAGLEVKWLRNRTVKPKSATTLMEAIARMEKIEKTKHSAHDRDEALAHILESIRPEVPAFMVVITMAVMPTAFHPTQVSSWLKEAMFKAHDRGLMALYIVPSQSKVNILRQICGFTDIPDTGEFHKNFERLQKDYYWWLKNSQGNVSLADKQMHLMEYDTFDMMGWLYIMTVIGEKTALGRVDVRIAERGPASRNLVSVVPAHQHHDIEVLGFVKRVLERTYREGQPEFVKRFLRRIKSN